MLDFQVGIVTFERPDILHRCLRLLRRDFGDDFEILVADQSERPAVRTCDRFDARLIDVEPDCGLSRSRNLLVKAATTDSFFMIDDDIEVDKRVEFDKLLDFLWSRPVIAVGPQLKQRPNARRPWIGRLGIGRKLCYRYDGLTAKVAPGRHITEALGPGCLMLKREEFLEFPFDERLKIGEGLEWCYRVKTCGGLLGYSEEGFVVHRQEEKTEETTARFKAYQEKAWRIMGIEGIVMVPRKGRKP